MFFLRQKSVDSKILIFVISVGRSGTTSVALRFGLTHEPAKGITTLAEVKKRIGDKSFYGEIGHHLLYVARELRQEYPNAVFIHLVRDSRKVVKSFQRLNTRRDNVWLGVKETPNEFERICKMWKKGNEIAEGVCDVRVRIEDFSRLLTYANERVYFGKVHADVPWTAEEESYWEWNCKDMHNRYGYE